MTRQTSRWLFRAVEHVTVTRDGRVSSPCCCSASVYVVSLCCDSTPSRQLFGDSGRCRGEVEAVVVVLEMAICCCCPNSNNERPKESYLKKKKKTYQWLKTRLTCLEPQPCHGDVNFGRCGHCWSHEGIWDDGREEKGKESGGSKEETTCQVFVCFVGHCGWCWWINFPLWTLCLQSCDTILYCHSATSTSTTTMTTMTTTTTMTVSFHHWAEMCLTSCRYDLF